MLISLLQRIGLWMVATASLVAAIFVVVQVGLPNRAEYTGFVSDEYGYVAPEIGEIAPPFIAERISGETVSLAELRGEWVIINFWATWCAPCAVEMPELQSLYENIDVNIIGVNIGESAAPVRAWVEEFELTFDIALDPQQEIYALYRVRGQPSTYVINPDGIITDIFYGPTSTEALQAIIES